MTAAVVLIDFITQFCLLIIISVALRNLQVPCGDPRVTISYRSTVHSIFIYFLTSSQNEKEVSNCLISKFV